MYRYILKLISVDIFWCYSMNEKSGSKETNFERTWKTNPARVSLVKLFWLESDKNKNSFSSASQNVHRGNFLDIGFYFLKIW